MKYDFITIGATTRDISFFTNEGVLIKNPKDVLRQELLAFEYGAKIKVDHFYYSYGGGAANAAVCLANFGFKTACLSTIGDDEDGRMILKNLKERKVSDELIKKKKGEESGSSFVLIAPAGERIIFSQRGSNTLLDLTKHDLKELDKAKNVYIASLAGNWVRNLKNIFSVAEDNGQKVFWNPGTTQLLSGRKKIGPFIKKVTVLALNKDEALQLLYNSEKFQNLNREFLNRPENLIKEIYGFGSKVVIITLGYRGVIAYDGKNIYRREIIKEKKRVDTTGIGDIFNSSFAAGYVMYRGDIDKALELALRNAAAKVGHLGAQNGLLQKKKNGYF